MGTPRGHHKSQIVSGCCVMSPDPYPTNPRPQQSNQNPHNVLLTVVAVVLPSMNTLLPLWCKAGIVPPEMKRTSRGVPREVEPRRARRIRYRLPQRERRPSLLMSSRSPWRVFCFCFALSLLLFLYVCPAGLCVSVRQTSRSTEGVVIAVYGGTGLWLATPLSRSKPRFFFL